MTATPVTTNISASNNTRPQMVMLLRVKIKIVETRV